VKPSTERVPGPGLCFGLGLLVTLVLGAGLGARNLLAADWAVGRVTREGNLVHAHAQILGFVLLFVIGIVGHAIPRISRQPVERPWLLWLAFMACVLGQLSFPVAIWLHQDWLEICAGALDLVAAVALGITVVAATRHTPAEMRTWLRLGSLALAVVASSGLVGAINDDWELAEPALWQLSLWGFIAPFIIGMSTHVLDMAGGFDVRPGKQIWLAGAWVLGLGLIVLAQTGNGEATAPRQRQSPEDIGLKL